jgi:hypothetical protein
MGPPRTGIIPRKAADSVLRTTGGRGSCRLTIGLLSTQCHARPERPTWHPPRKVAAAFRTSAGRLSGCFTTLQATPTTVTKGCMRGPIRRLKTEACAVMCRAAASNGRAGASGSASVGRLSSSTWPFRSRRSHRSRQICSTPEMPRTGRPCAGRPTRPPRRQSQTPLFVVHQCSRPRPRWSDQSDGSDQSNISDGRTARIHQTLNGLATRTEPLSGLKSEAIGVPSPWRGRCDRRRKSRSMPAPSYMRS